MVRYVTPSQYNAMVRQYNQRVKQEVDRINRDIDRVNRANRQVVDQYNRDVRRHSSDVERHRRQIGQNTARAITQYNQAVRAYNSAAKIDNQQLQRQITTVRSRPTVVQYETVVTKTVRLHEQYQRVRSEAVVSGGYEDLIVLAERETANSADVSDALTGGEREAPPIENTGILEYLADLSQDLCDRWKGAVYALNPNNPDAARHFCTSAREIFHEILQRWAADSDVESADPNCSRTPQGTPTRRAKISFMLRRKNVTAPELTTFVDTDVDNIVELFGVFNEATHGEAGKHGFAKLQAIRKRVEGGIMFLAAVAA